VRSYRIGRRRRRCGSQRDIPGRDRHQDDDAAVRTVPVDVSV